MGPALPGAASRPMLNDREVSAIAPCLADGPLADSGHALVSAARALGEGTAAQALRACAVAQVFALQERAFEGTADPTAEIVSGLQRVAETHRLARASGLDSVGAGSVEDLEATDVATDTGQHYGNLFAGLSPGAYFDETLRLLRERLERNGIMVPLNARVLDAGCGGGRYAVAWSRLGASEVVGVDISELGIADAARRAKDAGCSNVRYDHGSVLNLPCDDASFDVVFSNGVLHHTTDWEIGVNEIVRVLRPGGLGWLYLIENPGGLFWDLIELLRTVTRGDSKSFARQVLTGLGVPGNRVFYMLDHVMVPINLRLTAEEITTRLEKAGASGIRRLTRGTDFDRVEAIHRGDPFAEVKFGIGEHRFVFSKN